MLYNWLWKGKVEFEDVCHGLACSFFCLAWYSGTNENGPKLRYTNDSIPRFVCCVNTKLICLLLLQSVNCDLHSNYMVLILFQYVNFDLHSYYIVLTQLLTIRGEYIQWLHSLVVCGLQTIFKIEKCYLVLMCMLIIHAITKIGMT